MAGPPERIHDARWEWDIDGPSSATVAVSWSPDGCTVTSVQRLEPSWEKHWGDPAMLEPCAAFAGDALGAPR